VDSQKPIESLIVTLKCPQTLPAIQEIRHRISPDSVITLLQNGMGVYDELCEKVWPDTSRRPQFILGSTTHGVAPPSNSRAKGWRLQTKAGAVSTGGTVLSKAVLHHGMGDIKLSVVPDPRAEVDFASRLFPSVDSPTSPSLPLPSLSTHDSTKASPLEQTLSALLSLNDLSTTILPISQMHHQLLLKLVVNAAINPITAILGVRNGELIGSSPVHRMIVALASESSRVILSYLTSLHSDGASSATATANLARSSNAAGVSKDVQAMFQPSALQAQILNVCSLTAPNASSMLVDVEAGRQTEIDYINGYLVALGQRMNIPTPVNEMLMLMLKAKGVTCK
jgi:2-dehydropantoate 2-reductase